VTFSLTQKVRVIGDRAVRPQWNTRQPV